MASLKALRNGLVINLQLLRAMYLVKKLVPAMTVNPEIPNETVDITYDKIPEPQEGQEIISYQDANGQVIHTQTVTGEEGSDVSFKPEVPTNWQPTGDLPHSVKITGGTTVIVIEPVTVPVQEHKTVTRTIVEHPPSGDKQNRANSRLNRNWD